VSTRRGTSAIAIPEILTTPAQFSAIPSRRFSVLRRGHRHTRGLARITAAPERGPAAASIQRVVDELAAR
jgi:hypothetical protein